jgi:hypothetical protein
VRLSRFGGAEDASYQDLFAARSQKSNKGRPGIPPFAWYQKWMIRSLAAITAQFLEGAIPAAALPLNASAFSER